MSTVRYQVDAGVATLTIDRESARNALGPDEWRALENGVAQAGSDAAVRVVVVTGAGGAFSSGGDVKTMPDRLALDPAARREQLLADSRVIRTLCELPKPVVARIDGACVGAGLSLALACDLRLASTRSTFGAVFHRIGLTCDFGITHLLPRAIGHARAMELVMLADVIDSARAERIGLVHRVYETDVLDEELAKLTQRLVEGPPVAQALSKAGLARGCELDLAAALEWEAAAQAIASRTADAGEGLRAMHEKRKPRFEGR